LPCWRRPVPPASCWGVFLAAYLCAVKMWAELICLPGRNAKLSSWCWQRLGGPTPAQERAALLTFFRDLFDQVDDATAQFWLFDAREGFGQRKTFRGRQEVGYIGRRRSFLHTV